MPTPRAPIGILVLLLTALACSFATNLFSGTTEADGPILAVVTAASLDERGELVDPSYSFAQTAPQMAVVIQVGELVGSSQLNVAWFIVGEQGDEELFEHTIQVDAFDRAYSIGQNPGLLAPAAYKAVARLGDQTQTIEWIVEEPAETSASLNAAQGQAPASGASGKVPASQRVPEGSPLGDECKYSADVSPYPPMIIVSGFDRTPPNSASCVPPGDLEIMVWINDNPPKQGCTFNKEKISGCSLVQDPCKFPGGSDLPGTVVNVSLRPKNSDQELAASKVEFPKDTFAPSVQLVSEPSNGVKVTAGQEIKLTAIAEENKAAGWQTGVSKIEIFVIRPSGEQVASESYKENKGKACDDKTKKKTTEEYTYKVPKGLKGELYICAFADDFAEPPNTGQDCATFYTGQVWQGTMKSQSTSTMVSDREYTCSGEYETKLKLIIAADGSISGEGHTFAVSPVACNFELSYGLFETATLVVEGQAYPDRLEIRLGILDYDWEAYDAGFSTIAMNYPQNDVIIPITGPGRADGEWVVDQDTGWHNVVRNAFELRCVTCEPEPVSLL